LCFLEAWVSFAFAALQSCSVAIGTAVEFMAFSDPDMLASMTKSTQFICLLSADWNGVRP
jgi:hypothetical protein